MKARRAVAAAGLAGVFVAGTVAGGRAQTNVAVPSEADAGSPAVAFEAQLLPPVPAGTPREKDLLNQALAELSSSRRDEVQALLEQHFPREMRMFRQMLYDPQANPRAYLARLTGEASRLLRIREQDPALFRDIVRQKKLQREAALQARLVARSRGEGRQTQKEKLQQILSAEFDVRQRLMARELAGLETELANLKALIVRRQQKRGEIIERRINELTGEGDTQW